MRIGILCTQCMNESPGDKTKLYWAEVTDDGVHHLQCSRGHRNCYLLQEHKFELLFELALNAVIDTYYREAVTSFASCLERFHEFAIGVFAENAKIAEDEYKESWSLLAKQSERQLGAYVLSYLLSERVKPKVLSNKSVEFRNDVIHRGRIPSRDEAIDYGSQVLHVMFEPLRLLRRKYPRQCEAVAVAATNRARQDLEKKGTAVISFTYPMTLRNIRPETESPPELRDRIAEVMRIMKPRDNEA